ncbi:hypothetical protein [Sessilibacter corallicola]|uniref:hypothetical protein n=1 Tax=Sessilibacter corallicola TaxID=2904075 RepID=UPI001E4B9392|nr:hypothetical protein [Sessilibacter corallicola]MCE2027185.1 hypothetical protein [Sessilibacter corallicola]
MANYMTQSMDSPKTEKITYYRKQSQPHPSHEESSQFTRDAKKNYAEFNHIPEADVEEGSYRSGQGIPTGGKTYEI